MACPAQDRPRGRHRLAVGTLRLFFFYSSSCGACEVFSPIVRTLSDKYHLSVPVSMDGGPTPAFPRFVVNQGQYEKMGLEGGQVPALVLFDTYLKSRSPSATASWPRTRCCNASSI
jgi:hypothetical protein